MTYSKSAYAFSLLGALIIFNCIEAYAAPPVLGSGGMTNNLKSVQTNTDLVCDLDDPQSTLLITEIETPPSFTMETPPDEVIICREVPRPPSMDPPGPPIEFTLTQIGMMPNDGGPNGLVVNSKDKGDGTRLITWKFLVADHGEKEILEWRLAPKDQHHPVCEDPPYSGIFLSPCANRMGVDASPMKSDFPDRDLTGDGINDFGKDGVVFQYKELVLANGTRLPRNLLFGPCHSGSYNVNDSITCVDTTTTANLTGVVPVEVVIKPEAFNSGSQGKLDIRILGEDTLNPPPVEDLLVNGISLTHASRFSFADVNGDGFLDFRARVDRPAFAAALNCTSNGPTRILVSGTLDPGMTPFRGEDTIWIICF